VGDPLRAGRETTASAPASWSIDPNGLGRGPFAQACDGCHLPTAPDGNAECPFSRCFNLKRTDRFRAQPGHSRQDGCFAPILVIQTA
jgi:hypothetical protein